MRRAPTLLLLCLSGLLGCPEAPASPEVSDDKVLQARYLAGRRTLEEIRDRQRRGQPIDADCQALQLLFGRELRRLPAPEVRQLIEETETTCKGARPAEP